jgi:two-component system cell cycle response regulator
VATILVVDDEAPLRAVLSEAFAELGYRVLAAANGREALALLAQESVQLVLSDVMMPVMTGVELCQAVKALPELAKVPVILVTAAGRAAAEQAGADAVLDKPFGIDALEALVRRWLPGSR